jgi:hypothetical protein
LSKNQNKTAKIHISKPGKDCPVHNVAPEMDLDDHSIPLPHDSSTNLDTVFDLFLFYSSSCIDITSIVSDFVAPKKPSRSAFPNVAIIWILFSWAQRKLAMT